ncbi:pyrroline-5-carboxylate reductase [Pusillimonas sp. CC-YST705]|uniref:Pyrroline-5-carboxylate reductase n=1 Tax=Mesopusillimonas faecipullorum TaxID=2755040 RepID=A0ABS8CAN0_9BURK|nr:pyrroline-5-carboxylate reductase [Mesopusillimonas faecipullorum]MCB5363068.1 pyrroline-5-carboxylate reductase [Mesopusillimonas faecipullorum]
MNQELTLAFIGGGNMANALASGLIGKRCAASKVHVIDTQKATLQSWQDQGCTTHTHPDEQLSSQRVWVLAVKPQHMKEVAQQCRPYLRPDTLVISIAAGITSHTLGQWLGTAEQPWQRLVRCMPNTPALIGAGATGLLAGPAVDEQGKAVTEMLFKAVGQFVWFENDDQLDAVTALSGSGPAYVFLFIEALIQGGTQLGLSPQQARTLALATLSGATELAALSPDTPATLRERVTSKGGTTAAALQVFEQQGWVDTVRTAMQAAYVRAGQLAADSAQQ